MTTIILVLAVLSLTAGLFILFQGKASSKSGEESKDKVSIKKVVASIRKTVDEGTPVSEVGVEHNLLHSYRDPVEIYLDKNASDQEKDEAARILNENGYDVPRINSPENNTNSTQILSENRKGGNSFKTRQRITKKKPIYQYHL